MKRLVAVLAVALAGAHAALAAEPRAFGRGSFGAILQAHRGQPMVVHLWGLTCAPCLVELPRWGELARERRLPALVLIAADPAPQAMAQVAATLERVGLGGAESWSFADGFAERLRFEIDPKWAGELPRTVLIAADGSRTVLEGVADLARVRAWLDSQSME